MDQNNTFIPQHLISAIKKGTHLRHTNSTLLQEISKLRHDITNLSALISSLEDQSTREYPIIIGNASTRMSILSLGTLPSINRIDLIRKTAIFPINFISKRKYKKHHGCVKKSSEEKIFYLCKVTDQPVIECSCGKKYEVGDWELFKSETLCDDIESIEDFFGLTYIGLGKLVEELGDVSVYEGYKRWDER